MITEIKNEGGLQTKGTYTDATPVTWAHILNAVARCITRNAHGDSISIEYDGKTLSIPWDDMRDLRTALAGRRGALVPTEKARQYAEMEIVHTFGRVF